VCGDVPDSLLHDVLAGGVDIVQLRLKDGDDDSVLATAARFARACATHRALFILNDRPELVSVAGADGVHVGQDDMPVARARELVGPNRLVGLSTHSPAQIDQASEAAVDYIGVGPVHETPTKPGRPSVGLELVRYAASHSRHPFFAIGGIDPGNAGAVVEAGAERIAVVRAITQADDPGAAARTLRAALGGVGALGTRGDRVGAA
jgi:thiamine-phosphate pyrophosphorylase